METTFVQPRVMVAPLDFNPDRFGYQYLQKVDDQNVFHPGVDLNGGDSGNADLGMSVVAPADGTVVYSKPNGRGWGNLMVIYHKKLDCYSRIAHFLQLEAIEGDEVKMGQQIGLCGKSGTDSPHCHWELIRQKLGFWTMYPHGWTAEEVDEVWLDPLKTMEAYNKAAEIPEEAIPAVEWAIENKIAVDWSVPNEIVGSSVMEAIFFNAGFLKEKQNNLSKLRAIVALYRQSKGEKVR